ncbi:tetratricopeptide repeat protein 29-like isoform X2 [Lineus longissimus]|uniref:tetratricopeptide repeat protein 29-like isoform X2 n=1 Tax=Lineus longissimus TaxID=88925 RepID=UPI00315DD25D
MAAALPAISRGSTRGSQHSSKSPIVVQNVPSPPRTSPPQTGGQKFYLKPLKKSQGKKERTLQIRREQLRAQQPYLTKRETAAFRNIYLHTLCLDMLQEGFHRSFSELFALIRQQHAARDAAGPDSALWNRTLLEDEHEKLDTLKIHLTGSEEAGRKENFVDVYNSLYKLARYFQLTGDKWLSDHFFDKCLQTSSSVQGDEGRMLAEAHCNMGLAIEESNNLLQSAEQFESFHVLVKGRSWEDVGGESLHGQACNHLTRIYTAIAKKCEKDEPEQSLEYLIKAYNMAKEGGNKKMEGESSFRLGLGYDKVGNATTALLYLNRYFDMCKAIDDDAGLGLACEAIAKAYERQDKVEESIKYLQMFVEVAEKSGEQKAVSRACSDLGAVFNSLSRYEEASEYFTKAYNISRSLNDKEAISSSRVQYGIAIAHKMLVHVSKHVESANRQCVGRMVDWKSSRNDQFEKEIKDSAVETPSPSAPAQSGPSAAEIKEDEKQGGDNEQATQEGEEAPAGNGEAPAEAGEIPQDGEKVAEEGQNTEEQA